MLSNIRGRTAVLACAIVAGAFTTACSKQKAGSPHLEAIQIAPTSPQLAKGTSARLSATAIFHDHTTRDVTAEATWSSGDAAVAAVSAAGAIRGVGVGATSIRVTLPEGSTQTTVTVTSARVVGVQVTPPAASVPSGLSLRLTATATFTDSTTQDVSDSAVWSSSAPSILSVAGGVASAKAVGTVLVTAGLPEATGSAAVQVTSAQVASIEIHPASPTLPLGTSQPLQAVGHYTDHSAPDITSLVSWKSSDADVATVEGGLLRAIGVGSALVSASLPVGSCTADYGCETTTVVTVTPAMLTAIAIEPANLTMPAGLTRQYRAMGAFTDGIQREVTRDVLWESSLPEVAFVYAGAPSPGLLEARAVGSATVRATMHGWLGSAEGDVVATTGITVTDGVLLSITVQSSPETCREPCGSLALGLTRRLQAMARYSDGATLYDVTDRVTWSSANPSVAIVSNADGSKGLATSVGTGFTSITATCPRTLVSGSKTLWVSQKLLVSLRIEPPSATVPKGNSQDFVAIGRFTDNTEDRLTTIATWSAENAVTIQNVCSRSRTECVARASTKYADPLGVSTVTARMADGCTFCQVTGISATAQLEVTAAVLQSIEITPPADSPSPFDIPARLHYALTATGTYSDGSTPDVTALVAWSAGDTAVATVTAGPDEQRGVVQGWKPGKTEIFASLDHVNGTASLAVNDLELASIVVAAQKPAPTTESTHVNYRLPLGMTADFRATGIYTKPSRDLAPVERRYNITSMAVWEDHPFVEAAGPIASVTLDTSVSAHVHVLAELVGHSTLSAEDPHTGKRGETVFEAIDAIPVKLAVTPTSATIAKGTSQQFEATVTYSDGTSQVQTDAASWTSGNTYYAVPSTVEPGSFLGKRTTVGAPVVVTATLRSDPGISGTALLTVKAAELLSIAVEPADQTLPLGTTLRLKATGTYSDGSTQDLTRSVVWDSSAHELAIVSNAIGSRGLAISLAQGVVTVTSVITDPYDGDLVSGSTTLTIGPPATLSIIVLPTCKGVLIGETVQYAATAFYTDGSDADVTAAVGWSTSAPLVASIDASGLATALTKGQTLIAATDATGVSGTTKLNVSCRCDCACEVCACE